MLWFLILHFNFYLPFPRFYIFLLLLCPHYFIRNVFSRSSCKPFEDTGIQRICNVPLVLPDFKLVIFLFRRGPTLWWHSSVHQEGWNCDKYGTPLENGDWMKIRQHIKCGKTEVKRQIVGISTVVPEWKQWLSGLGLHDHFCCCREATKGLEGQENQQEHHCLEHPQSAINELFYATMKTNTFLKMCMVSFLHLKYQHLGVEAEESEFQGQPQQNKFKVSLGYKRSCPRKQQKIS